MKLTFGICIFSLLAVAQPASAQKPAQATSGNCSPNISNTGSGNVTLQFSGNACQGIDPAAVKKLNDFLATFPKQQSRLLELLDVKDADLKAKVNEVAELTVKYEESSKQLEALGRPEHMAKLIQMNAISAKDRAGLDGTIRELERVLSKTNFQLTPENLVRLGWYCTMVAQFDKAEALFLDATRQNPSLGPAYFGLAYVTQMQGHEYLQHGDPDKAKEALDKAEGYAKIAGQYDEFDSAALVQIGYTEKDLALAYSDKGMKEKAGTANQSAVRHFNMALGANPRDAGAHNGLGDICFENGDLDAAIREYQSATSIEQKYTFAWFDLVLALRQKYGSAGQSKEQNVETLRSFLTAVQKVLELSQDSEAQQLPQEALQKILELAQWGGAEAAKYKQANQQK